MHEIKKIAFFVEGQTEQIFVHRLVKEIMGSGNTTIILKKISGGTNTPKHEFVRSYDVSRKAKYSILIYDCGADNRVKSEILENIDSLYQNGFSAVIGLRDLYPLSMDELTRLEKGLAYLPHHLQQRKHLFDIVVAVREVETWFLAESSFLQKVDGRLTGHYIEKHLGFNPYLIDPLSRQHPAADLDCIYKLVGKSYTKKYYQVEKLVKKLDFNVIRHQIRHKITSLNTLIALIERLKKGN
ncbi:MAG: hypothetical protein RL662_1485 [Bacteroidota bacterium]|jgi:hypothetical protein